MTNKREPIPPEALILLPDGRVKTLFQANEGHSLIWVAADSASHAAELIDQHYRQESSSEPIRILRAGASQAEKYCVTCTTLRKVSAC